MSSSVRTSFLAVTGTPPNTSGIVSRALLAPLAKVVGADFSISREFGRWLEHVDEDLRWWLERRGSDPGETVLPTADRLTVVTAELLSLHYYVKEVNWPTPLDLSSLTLSDGGESEPVAVETLVDVSHAVVLQYATESLQNALGLIRSLRRDVKRGTGSQPTSGASEVSFGVVDFVIAAPTTKTAFQRALAAFRTATVLDEALTRARKDGYRMHPRVAHCLFSQCNRSKSLALALAASTHLSFAIMSTGRAQLRPFQVAVLAAGASHYFAAAAGFALHRPLEATVPTQAALLLVSRWLVGLSTLYRAKHTHQVPRGEIPDMALATGLVALAIKLLRPSQEAPEPDAVRRGARELFPLVDYFEAQANEYQAILQRENELVYHEEIKPGTVTIPSLDTSDELPDFATKEDATSEALKRLLAMERLSVHPHQRRQVPHRDTTAEGVEEENGANALLTTLFRCAPSREAIAEAAGAAVSATAAKRAPERPASAVASSPPATGGSAADDPLPPAAKVGGRLKQLLSREKRQREE